MISITLTAHKYIGDNALEYFFSLNTLLILLSQKQFSIIPNIIMTSCIILEPNLKTDTFLVELHIYLTLQNTINHFMPKKDALIVISND